MITRRSSFREWTLNGAALDMNDPRLLAMAEAQRHYIETDYDEYDASNASGAAFCRSTALIVSSLILIVLNHLLIKLVTSHSYLQEIKAIKKG